MRRTDSAPDTARTIAALLAQLDARAITRTTWLGHSGGAHIALEAAHRYPNRVERLIVIAAAPSARRLASVPCPTFVMLGDRDGLTVASGPNVHVEVIAGAGHDPHLESASEVRALIARWRHDQE